MDAAFWMGGRLATGLEEISSDIESMNQPGFRAVIGSFENQWTIAKFSKVVDAHFRKRLPNGNQLRQAHGEAR